MSKMKKNKLFLAILPVIAITLSLVSCKKSSDDDQLPSKDATVQSIDAGYYLKTEGDFLKVFELTVQYKDASGNVKSESITSSDFEKKVNIKNFPFTAGMKAVITMKSIDQSSKYDLGYAFGIVYTINYSDGKSSVLGSKNMVNISKGVYDVPAYFNVSKKVLLSGKADLLTVSGNKVSKADAAIDF